LTPKKHEFDQAVKRDVEALEAVEKPNPQLSRH
jgi:hypothetical protein